MAFRRLNTNRVLSKHGSTLLKSNCFGTRSNYVNISTRFTSKVAKRILCTKVENPLIKGLIQTKFLPDPKQYTVECLKEGFYGWRLMRQQHWPGIPRGFLLATIVSAASLIGTILPLGSFRTFLGHVLSHPDPSALTMQINLSKYLLQAQKIFTVINDAIGGLPTLLAYVTFWGVTVGFFSYVWARCRTKRTFYKFLRETKFGCAPIVVSEMAKRVVSAESGIRAFFVAPIVHAVWHAPMLLGLYHFYQIDFSDRKGLKTLQTRLPLFAATFTACWGVFLATVWVGLRTQPYILIPGLIGEVVAMNGFQAILGLCLSEPKIRRLEAATNALMAPLLGGPPNQPPPQRRPY